MSTGYTHSVVFDLTKELLSDNTYFRHKTEYHNLRFIFEFQKNTVKDKRHNIQYWGALAKIKPIDAQNIDPLYKKRIITILFGCNNRISSARFKGSLENYSYVEHGKALRKDALLRYNHLMIAPKIRVTINIRFCCRCGVNHLNSKKFHPQCEIHSKKQESKKRTKNTLPFLWNQQPFKKRKICL